MSLVRVEEIVELYMVGRRLPPLKDPDKALNGGRVSRKSKTDFRRTRADMMERRTRK